MEGLRQDKTLFNYCCHHHLVISSQMSGMFETFLIMTYELPMMMTRTIGRRDKNIDQRYGRHL